MANNDNSLFLPTSDDPVRAIVEFEKFVKDTGGNAADLNDALDLFHQWREIREPTDADGVIFTADPDGALGNWEITAMKRIKRNGQLVRLVSKTK